MESSTLPQFNLNFTLNPIGSEFHKVKFHCGWSISLTLCSIHGSITRNISGWFIKTDIVRFKLTLQLLVLTYKRHRPGCCEWYLEEFPWNYPPLSADVPHWWHVSTDSSNDMVPSGKKPSHQPMFNHIYYHMASLGRNGLVYDEITEQFEIPWHLEMWIS